MTPNARWACKLPAVHGANCTANCNDTGTSFAFYPTVATCKLGGQAADECVLLCSVQEAQWQQSNQYIHTHHSKFTAGIIKPLLPAAYTD